jgi:cell division protease FtsH
LNDLAKNIVLWIVIAVVVATVVSNFSARSGAVQDIPYSTFLEQVKDGGIAEVKINPHTDVIKGTRTNGEPFIVYSPETDNDALMGMLEKSGVKFDGTPPERQSFLMQLFISSFPSCSFPLSRSCC